MRGASEALRRGWCPGALRPMQARDGLLVRLRITGGIVPAAIARALADLAKAHGNGLFDLSTRSNLQMRGVTDYTLFPLQSALRDLGLLDVDIAAESVRNVIASPLAGLHAGLDIRPIVAALEARLAGTEALHALPGKFGFLIDDGGSPSLATVGADVRFDWHAPSRTFSIGLGGSARDALRVGSCGAEALCTEAERLARIALSFFARSRSARRMRMLIHEFGADTMIAASGAEAADVMSEVVPIAPSIVGLQTYGGLPVFGLHAPFGRLTSAMLEAAAECATKAGGEIRVTPWRALLVAGVDPAIIDRAALGTTGLIVDGDDPRLAVAACTGREGCARGSTSIHADAAVLAAALSPQLLQRGGAGARTPLHVSGCLKGCAKAAPSPVTLVAQNGLYALVRDGRASDFPMLRDLDLPAARAAIEALLAPS